MKMRIALLVLAGFALHGWAQNAPPPKGVPQGKEWRPPVEGVPSDPGAWDRWVQQYYQIVKVPRGLEYRLGGNLAYPDIRVKALMEIVAEDDQFVYLRNLPLEDPRSAGHRGWLARQRYEAKILEGEDFYADKFVLLADENAAPPPFTARLAWEDLSQGLPTGGLWQMGFDVADLDGDGVVDLVFPPPRKGNPWPSVFLQKRDGWKAWEQVKWPDLPFDYGDVKVADFDGDGRKDIVIVCHFRDSYVLFGNGAGDFTRYVKLPRGNASATYRTVAVADFDRDGRPDIARLAELDIDMGTNVAIQGGLLSVLRSRGKEGFEEMPTEAPAGLFGDQMAVGDFNGDGYPDLVTASHKANNDAYIFLNQGGKRLVKYTHLALPFRAYVLAVAAGKLDGKGPEQVILGIAQSMRREQRPYSFVHAIVAYRLADKTGKLFSQPERKVLFKEDFRETDLFRSLAAADVDGDKRLDIVAGRSDSGLVVLLQNPDGSFLRELNTPRLEMGSPNSVRIVDLSGSGRPHLVVNFSDSQQGLGGVKVWRLSRETKAAPPPSSHH